MSRLPLPTGIECGRASRATRAVGRAKGLLALGPDTEGALMGPASTARSRKGPTRERSCMAAGCCSASARICSPGRFSARPWHVGLGPSTVSGASARAGGTRCAGNCTSAGA